MFNFNSNKTPSTSSSPLEHQRQAQGGVPSGQSGPVKNTRNSPPPERSTPTNFIGQLPRNEAATPEAVQTPKAEPGKLSPRLRNSPPKAQEVGPQGNAAAGENPFTPSMGALGKDFAGLYADISQKAHGNEVWKDEITALHTSLQKMGIEHLTEHDKQDINRFLTPHKYLGAADTAENRDNRLFAMNQLKMDIIGRNLVAKGQNQVNSGPASAEMLRHFSDLINTTNAPDRAKAAEEFITKTSNLAHPERFFRDLQSALDNPNSPPAHAFKNLLATISHFSQSTQHPKEFWKATRNLISIAKPIEKDLNNDPNFNKKFSDNPVGKLYNLTGRMLIIAPDHPAPPKAAAGKPESAKPASAATLPEESTSDWKKITNYDSLTVAIGKSSDSKRLGDLLLSITNKLRYAAITNYTPQDQKEITAFFTEYSVLSKHPPEYKSKEARLVNNIIMRHKTTQLDQEPSKKDKLQKSANSFMDGFNEIAKSPFLTHEQVKFILKSLSKSDAKELVICDLHNRTMASRDSKSSTALDLICTHCSRLTVKDIEGVTKTSSKKGHLARLETLRDLAIAAAPIASQIAYDGRDSGGSKNYAELLTNIFKAIDNVRDGKK